MEKKLKNAPAQAKMGNVYDEFTSNCVEALQYTAIPNYKGDGCISSFDAIVTPEMAKKLLSERNIKNYRKMDRNHIQELATEMRLGNWAYNGDSIKFDWDGYLMDGQHRLSAVVEYGKWVCFHIVEGLDPADVDKIDTATKKRSLANNLKYNYQDAISGASSVTSAVMRLRKELYSHDQGRIQVGINDSQVIAEFGNDPVGYNNAARIGKAIARKSRGLFNQRQVGSYYYYLTNDLGYDGAYVEEFFNRVSAATPYDTGLYKNARNRLEKLKNSTAAWTWALIDCWNSYVNGNTNNILCYGSWFKSNKAVSQAC